LEDVGRLITASLSSKKAFLEITTVDGRNPAPPGDVKNLVNTGVDYQPQLASRISSIN